MRRTVSASFAVLLMVVGALSSISNAQQPQQPNSLHFEVAAIRPGNPQMEGASSSSTDRERVRIVNMPLKEWVKKGLSVRDYALQAPSWLDSSRFDLNAKLPAGKPSDQQAIAEMMKALLIERFGLKWHEEIRTVLGYELVTDKKVLIKPSGLLERLRGPGSGSGPTLINGTNMSMSELAGAIGEVLGKPVVDATHLSGGFDIRLTWSPLDDAAMVKAKEHGMDNFDNLPSIFTAVREQLGLRLQSARVPSKVIVVDQIYRKPTEN